jgi:hypothetical protein
LEAAGVSKDTLKDAKTINNKLTGKRSKAPAKPAPSPDGSAAAAKTISVSQLSYDSQIDTFSRLIELLGTEPLYKPNEPELQVPNLSDLLSGFRELNTATITAYTAYSNKIIERNNLLYTEETGLVPLAINVKKYVKSVFGATSPQYKQVSALEFKVR